MRNRHFKFDPLVALCRYPACSWIVASCFSKASITDAELDGVSLMRGYLILLLSRRDVLPVPPALSLTLFKDSRFWELFSSDQCCVA